MPKNKTNKRPKSRLKRLLTLLKVLVIFVLLGLLVWGIRNLQTSKIFDVHIDWNIEKTLPIQQAVLMQSIAPLTQKNYLLDLHRIKQTLESHPWIALARVKRTAFNALHIKINAQQIALRWQNKNCDTTEVCQGYIAKNGELFIPQQRIDSEAPLVISANNAHTIKTLYQHHQKYQAILKPMTIKSYQKTNIDTLTIQPNIQVVLGTKNQQQRLSRFKKVYQKLRKKTKKVEHATFDMRYAKSFSLRYD